MNNLNIARKYPHYSSLCNAAQSPPRRAVSQAAAQHNESRGRTMTDILNILAADATRMDVLIALCILVGLLIVAFRA